LEEKLRALESTVHLGHTQAECQTIPMSETEVVALMGALDWHMVKSTDILKYQCPCCRKEITRVPVVQYALKEILDGTWDLVGSDLAMTRSNDAPSDAFAGLFIPSYLID
jgi:hypothetical protein